MNSSVVSGASTAVSFPLIIPIACFAIATLCLLASLVLRKSALGKLATLATIFFCCVSIAVTGFFGIRFLPFFGASKAGSTAEESDLCNDVIRSFELFGYSDIKVKLADLGGAEGNEAIFYYRNNDTHVVDIYGKKDGTFQSVYSVAADDTSVFLVNRGGEKFLLAYTQTLDDNYTQRYTYKLFKFNSDYSLVDIGEDNLTVKANAQGGGSAGADFFSVLNGYLSEAEVCYDPFSLTGYSSMQPGSDSMQTNSKYLRITNCSTNKTGIVKMKKDTSWLNLREGPSRAYDPVLINPRDKESYVKQTQNSLVTVIVPENTTDADYPVWYKIRITYNNYTLEGYSAQNYINVENITKLPVGSTFTVEAETNDTGITWCSSDPAIASVDPDTGVITGKKRGVVLISVGTDSGLSDSCLVMIE